jgi:polysaccharide biosynthesis protein PslH
VKILVVSPVLPYPPDAGGAIRTFSLIKYLSAEHEVELLCLAEPAQAEKAVPKLREYCSAVHTVAPRRLARLLQIPSVIGRFARGEPFMLKYGESKEMGALLTQLTDQNDFDVVQFEHSYAAGHVHSVSPSARCKKVLSTHNVAWAQYYRIYRSERKLVSKIKFFLEWFPMMNWEANVGRLFDKAIVVSAMDMYLLRFLNPSLDISIIPNGVDTQGWVVSPDPVNSDILFVGSMDYRPNTDAALYFHDRVFPLIRERIPGARFWIVGRQPPPEILKLAENPYVVVRADVSDIRSYYGQVAVTVVPLRSGGGTRLKILESMAAGIPVVSTSVGCEGLDLIDGQDILIADDPQSFADRVVELLSRRPLWKRLSVHARARAEQSYDWRNIATSLAVEYRALVNS